MKSFAPLALLAASVAAKTDLEGCTSFTSMVTVRTEIGYGNTYQSVIWYDPENLEICQGVDCGGGRAPPKTVPGCPAYSGTETVTPEFLSEDPLKPTASATTEAPEATTTSAGDDDDEDGGEQEEETSAPPTSGASTSAASKTSSTATETKSSSPPDSGNDDEDGNEEDTDNENGEGEDSEDSENPETTNSPDAAMPTGMSAMNVAAGLAAAAVALL